MVGLCVLKGASLMNWACLIARLGMVASWQCHSAWLPDMLNYTCKYMCNYLPYLRYCLNNKLLVCYLDYPLNNRLLKIRYLNGSATSISFH